MPHYRLTITHADLGKLNEPYPAPDKPYTVLVPNVAEVTDGNHHRHYIDPAGTLIATVPEDIIIKTETLP